jgi:hypothetical protein
MGTGALLGEGKKDETLANMALFGIFEGASHLIGTVPKRIAESTAWRKATIKERGLMVQSLDDFMKNNPNATEGQIARQYPEYFRQAKETRMKIEGEPIRPERTAEPEPRTVTPEPETVTAPTGHDLIAKRKQRNKRADEIINGKINTAEEFIAQANREYVPESGNLERGGDVYTERAGRLPANDLIKVLNWAKEHESPYINRFIASNIDSVLRQKAPVSPIAETPPVSEKPITEATEAPQKDFTPAIRYKDGTIRVGDYHAQIWEKYGFDDGDALGVTTKDGRFLTEDELEFEGIEVVGEKKKPVTEAPADAAPEPDQVPPFPGQRPGLPTPKERLLEEPEKQYWEGLQRKRAAVENEAQGIVERHGKKPIVLTKPGTNRGYILHKSTKRRGKIQKTSWDEKGFFGDDQHDTLEKAVSEALMEGYNIVDPQKFEKISRGRKFRKYPEAKRILDKYWAGEPSGPPIEVGPEVKPKPAEPEVGGPKEPWEMTKQEWAEKELKIDRKIRTVQGGKSQIKTIKRFTGRGFSFEEGGNLKWDDTTIGTSHIDSIKQALSENKPVPAEVLADYPDLKQKPAEPEVGGPKEPWEMTEDEYIDHVISQRPSTPSRESNYKYMVKQIRKSYKKLKLKKAAEDLSKKWAAEDKTIQTKPVEPKKAQILDQEIAEKGEKDINVGEGEPPLPPREQKKWLLEEIDEAIEKAPAQLTEDLHPDNKITFHVPGDGEFTIFNDKASLEEFKKRAKKFPAGPLRRKKLKSLQQMPVKAQRDLYEGYAGKTVKQQVEVDGEIITIEKPAAKRLKEIDDDISAHKQLLDCIKALGK